MADNIDVAPSIEKNRVAVATDEITGFHYPIYNVSYGALGIQTPVDETNPLPCGIHDGFGNPIASLHGALNIHDADVHNIAVNSYVHQHDPVVVTTLSADSAANDLTINVATTTGFTVGDSIHVNTTTIEPTHPSITAIGAGTPGTLTLDRRLDMAHFTGDDVIKVVIDLSSQVGT